MMSRNPHTVQREKLPTLFSLQLQPSSELLPKIFSRGKSIVLCKLHCLCVLSNKCVISCRLRFDISSTGVLAIDL